ncbi:MAG: FAD-binding oxidoreductase [Fibrobacteres bacterium]|nr:FAD-binding oxidoreductase [Fibrobacterota bacterium]
MQLPKQLITELSERLAKNSIDLTPEAALSYSYDASKREHLPDAVLLPSSKNDVASIVTIARKYHIPVTVRGAGTGLTGGALAVTGGLVISMERMNKVITIDPDERIAIVEPGVINGDLEARLKKYSLSFPCDPSSAAYSTIGGNVAENGCGYKGRFYGSCSAHVAGLVYVNDEGTFISTGYFNKGQNTLSERLMVGSEGTGGIIVRIALRLISLPKEYSTSLHFFKSSSEAVKCAQKMIAYGKPPASIEYMDSPVLTAIAPEGHKYNCAKGTCALLIENCDRDAVKVGSFGNSPTRSIIAADANERAELWAFRNSISSKLYNIKTDKINEDVAVPISRLDDFAAFLDEKAASLQKTQMFNFGHMSVGCFHVTIMYNASEEGAREEALNVVSEVMHKTAELEGTISCEHGIGLSKKEFMKLEMNEEQLAFHRRIKESFDPESIFNPGKIND